jgi:hypothetical protein
MGLFARRHQPNELPDPGVGMTVVPDLFLGRHVAPAAVLSGPSASDPAGFDVFSNLTEEWGKGQTLLGYAARVRCDPSDAAGWEFRRAAERASDTSRRLDEDDTTLQVVALRGYCASYGQWEAIRLQHHDLRHDDFDRLGQARFTALDHSDSPVCLFRIGLLVVRVRMTGTLAQRQYARVYALDVSQRLDMYALDRWSNRAAALL